MPDRYGNPTMADWLSMTKSVSAMNANNKYKKYEDAKEDMVKQHGGIGEAVSQGDPSTMNQYQVKAYKDLSSDYSSAMGAKRDRAVESAKSNIMNGIKQAGGDPFAYFNANAPETEAELRATAEVRELFSKDSGFQKKMFENRAAMANTKGQEAMTILGQAQNSLAHGDPSTAGRLIDGMTRNIPMRGHYEFDEDTGLLHRMYLSREEGWQDTGETMSVPDFMQYAQGFTQQEFTAQVATHMRATSQFNREQILKGGQEATGPNGEKFKVYAQIDPQKFDDVQYIVHQNGKQLGVYTVEQLQQSGVQVRNMEHEKAQADLAAKKTGIAYTQQQTKASEASQKATERNIALKEQEAKTKAAKASSDAKSDNIAELEKSMKFVGAQLAEKTGMSDFAALLSSDPESMSQQERNSTVSAVTELARSGSDVEKQLAGRYLKMLGQWDGLRFGGESKAAPSGAGKGQASAMGKPASSGGQSWKDYR